ncbi:MULTISPECIES: DUF4124 domain-containing protein [Pseudoalteromonas]|jgi:hypothetical protein|uniref:DUF4124 domain-containing protein n=1 Tax=Pseudoalteromonas carrageenovora IAM 12662 TaxID=1314868 RepID=A0A2K4XA63_PSEVC|nr:MULTISPECIES: DUF4124 domain-containing protein [Pseudoalteromonas]KTF10474.1 hypothetical protein ATS74_11040 [Pseudoalteromonas sp. H103]MBE0381314.1 hypothetical protein [Pseudoalteromonas carrageenovora IAM 12662]MDO6463863.1 DUF4124 domain-containing protein [Pseudoalteromonas carrageenovora]MDO6636459.1 DUF4124 domain-containing protein [Pseudoalteromonas carrageenovora]MDO6647175.1 DUF4124 domain-containing protein [Pseudoalteromonas carrageenovora]
MLRLIYCSLLFTSFCTLGNTTYYKCVTKNGTTFSQFPCDDKATTYKVSTTGNQYSGPKVNYTKQLNELERERLLTGLEAEVRSNNHKLAILDREKQRAEYKQQERLNHILADDDKKRITKDITKKLKVINQSYKKDVATITKHIKKLEKKIAQYQ